MRQDRPSLVAIFVLLSILMLSACAAKHEQSDMTDESSLLVQQEAEEEKSAVRSDMQESSAQLVETESEEEKEKDEEEEEEDTPEIAALKDSIRSVEVGDTFFLGTCEQDNDLENGFESIEWVMLYKTEGEAFVISKKALEYMPFAAWYTQVEEFNNISQTLLRYDEFNSYFTWEEGFERNPPRIWLRDVVYEQGFSETEKAIVKTSFIQTAIRYNQIVTTKEHLYVPELEEVKLYLQTPELLQAEMTEYVKEKAIRVEGDYVSWSVRNMGVSEGYSMQVLASGEVSESGIACVSNNGVRPVMWLDIS